MRYSILLIMLSGINAPVSSSSSPLRDKTNKWEIPQPCQSNEVQSNVSILTYNTWGLPINLPGHQQEFRFSRIPAALKGLNATVICLQETFHPALRKEISETLLHEYPYHTDLACHREPYGLVDMDCYGGLATLSKYPILSEQFYAYPLNANYSLIEKTGQKGFLVTSICIGDIVIHVVNTHLYAGNSRQAEVQRELQFNYFTEVLQSRHLLEETVILAGDMNIQHSSISKSPMYDVLTTAHLWKDVQPVIDTSHFTSDHVANDYVSDREPRAKLDYIFYRKKPTTSMRLIDSYKCLDKKPLLSDHFGWMAIFQISGTNSMDAIPLASNQSALTDQLTVLNK